MPGDHRTAAGGGCWRALPCRRAAGLRDWDLLLPASGMGGVAHTVSRCGQGGGVAAGTEPDWDLLPATRLFTAHGFGCKNSLDRIPNAGRRSRTAYRSSSVADSSPLKSCYVFYISCTGACRRGVRVPRTLKPCAVPCRASRCRAVQATLSSAVEVGNEVTHSTAVFTKTPKRPCTARRPRPVSNPFHTWSNRNPHTPSRSPRNRPGPVAWYLCLNACSPSCVCVCIVHAVAAACASISCVHEMPAGRLTCSARGPGARRARRRG